MTRPTHDLSRLAPRGSDHENYDRMRDAMAEALNPDPDYPPLEEDLPPGWRLFDDD